MIEKTIVGGYLILIEEHMTGRTFLNIYHGSRTRGCQVMWRVYETESTPIAEVRDTAKQWLLYRLNVGVLEVSRLNTTERFEL